MKKLHNGLYEFDLELDCLRIKDSCYQIAEHIKNLEIDDYWYLPVKNSGVVEHVPTKQLQAPNSTKTFSQYNVFTYILPELNKLYRQIQKSFYLAEQDYYGKNLPANYFMQSWLNVYRHDQFIDWHGHHYNVARAWHGFYCVDAEPSNTTYRFIDNDTLVVPSKNNKLLIGLCENNTHKTDPWPHVDRDRITIAFDIIPELGLRNASPNHWIPI